MNSHIDSLEYLDFLSAKRHVTPGSITALRTGFGKVMETVGGDDWEKMASLPVNNMKESSPNQAANETLVQPVPSKSNLVAFPFPLSDGTLATLYLPSTINTHDAKRMSRFVETLVIERPDDE